MKSDILNKIPPHDIDAEKSVLGSMLMDQEAIIGAMEILTGDEFYRNDHKIIFEAITELFNKEEPVDIITVKNKIETKGYLEQIADLTYFSELVSSVVTSIHVKNHAKIVKDKSILRRLINSSQKIMGLSYEGKNEINDLLNIAETDIFNISQNRSQEGYVKLKDILVQAFEKIEDVYHNKGKLTGIPTGFMDIDHKTAGLQSSDLILIAARPSVGKSTFAINIAQNAAIKYKIPTVIFSLEMSKEQLVNKMIASEAMIDLQKMRTGALEQEDWIKIARTMAPLSEAPIYIDDTPGISVSELRAKCRRLKMEKGIGLVVIDYLQLMTAGGLQESRQQEISTISRTLKSIAREINAPVVALSQLSRACETRVDHRPMLSDLRESGAIEQDADVVMLLYRDEYYNPDTDKKNQAEIIIAKQRNGPTGTVDLMFFGNYSKFANMQK
ncbi:MAG TPA: replicative DNA helicase [Clostridiales bacterium]|nr:MAG: replicative DNA helicase [Clostridiales bacterium GWD2_32_19]HCC07902.1 replicative DNA helicase [Clostridiales bacterium]